MRGSLSRKSVLPSNTWHGDTMGTSSCSGRARESDTCITMRCLRYTWQQGGPKTDKASIYRRVSTLTTHHLIRCVLILCSADTAFAAHLSTQTSSWSRNINVRLSGMLRTEKNLVWDGKENIIYAALFVLSVNLSSS